MQNVFGGPGKLQGEVPPSSPMNKSLSSPIKSGALNCIMRCIMRAAPPLPKYPLISSYQKQKHLAQISVISIYFYCWWMEDVSFQTPFLPPPYIATQLQKDVILKPESRPSPKSQTRTRLEPDIYF